MITNMRCHEFELSKQKKYAHNSMFIDMHEDDMPFQHRHIRNILKSVRAEYYVVTHKLKSELHV